MLARARSARWLAAQVVFAACVIGLAVWLLARQWDSASADLASLRPNWLGVAAASALVFGAYLVLIETWRATLAAMHSRLDLGDAARIWFVSNLGRYIPGKVWQIAAMSVLAQQRGISPVAATGASLVVNLVNLVSGLALTAVAGTELLLAAAGGVASRVALFATLLVAALALLPWATPRIVRIAGRLMGRELSLPAVPHRVLWLAAGATGIAWLLYGFAFALLAKSLFPEVELTAGAVSGFIAAFTGSYLAGYLALFAPGGVGVRESTLLIALMAAGPLSAPQAAVLAVASRLWLTVLELVPGLAFIAVHRFGRPTTPSE